MLAVFFFFFFRDLPPEKGWNTDIRCQFVTKNRGTAFYILRSSVGIVAGLPSFKLLDVAYISVSYGNPPGQTFPEVKSNTLQTRKLIVLRN